MANFQFNDISGGQRQSPPRLFPPNAVEVAKNVIPSVDDSMFVVSPNVSTLLSTPDETNYKLIDAIIIGVTSGDEMYYIETHESTSHYNFYLVRYNGSSKVYIKQFQRISNSGSIYSKVKSIIGDIICHSFSTPLYPLNDNPRSTYKQWEYNKFYTDYDETEMREVPDLVDLPGDYEQRQNFFPAYPSGSYNGSDIPILFQTQLTGYYFYRFGVRIDGFQSIVKKHDSDYEDSKGNAKDLIRIEAEEDSATLVSITVPQGIKDRITGIDVYGLHSEAERSYKQDFEDWDWLYLDTFPFDFDEPVITLEDVDISVAGTVTGGDLTGKTYDTNQWAGACLEYDGSYYLIRTNDADSLSVYGLSSDSSVDVVIRWRWVLYSGYYHLKVNLPTDSGERLIQRTGVHSSIIEEASHYCPPAKFIESFKGFIWIAYYSDSENIIHKDRLVRSIVNSDGLVCQDVYNLADYIEFSSEITGIKAMRDYMLVITMDGVYTVRFVPSQDISGFNWSIKKISDIVFRDIKQISGIADNAVLWNNRVIYTCDGFQLTPTIDLEQQEMLDEYMSSTGKENNYYSIFYDQFNGHILLGLNDIIRYVKGIFTLDLDATYNNKFIGNYERDPVLMTDYKMLLVQDIQSDSHGSTFEVISHYTDFDSKEDKNFIVAVVRAYKGNPGSVIVTMYLDGEIVQIIEYEDGTNYDNYRDIFCPKSEMRRFTKIKFQIATGDVSSADFKLKSIDVEFEPIRRTNIDTGAGGDV